MNLSTVKWAQWDKTQSRDLLGLFIYVCIALCTIVAHNIAQNRPDSFPPYPPDNQHCSDDVYLREGGFSWCCGKVIFFCFSFHKSGKKSRLYNVVGFPCFNRPWRKAIKHLRPSHSFENLQLSWTKRHSVKRYVLCNAPTNQLITISRHKPGSICEDSDAQPIQTDYARRFARKSHWLLLL